MKCNVIQYAFVQMLMSIGTGARKQHEEEGGARVRVVLCSFIDWFLLLGVSLVSRACETFVSSSLGLQVGAWIISLSLCEVD